MKKWLQLVYWKRRLRHRYLRMRAIADSFDCGHALASHISLRYSDSVKAVNEAIRKINQLDPTVKLKELEEL